MFPQPIEQSSTFNQIAYRVLVIAAVILWLLPLAGIILTSLRSLVDINSGNYWGWPERLYWENYLDIFAQTPMARYMFNSLFISITATFAAVALSTMAGFALAKYEFRLNITLFAIFVGGNFVPFQILMIPVRDLTIQMGMYDTYWGLILFHTAFQSGFCTLFMRNFIKTLPEELFESARSEGVSEWRIFWYIAVPLVRPALAALSVLIFTFIWNDFFWALILVQSDEVRPVTAALNALKGQWLASWQLLSAGAIIAAIPPVMLFFFMQKQFIAGLTLGATKG